MFTTPENVIQWQKKHGRHDLPWQANPTPYHVWVSEVMLQQTQVQTVIPYFQRFMTQCPTIETLANIPNDNLMQLWQGLGYYSRARNLQKAAKMIMSDFNGEVPSTREQLMMLPGIGRSTAAAIMSLAYQVPDAILDGNVKRVLCRFHGIEGDPKDSTNLKKLWAHAESHIPNKDPRAYTQGMMDLGANICKRTQPTCEYCPLQPECFAFKHQVTHLIPAKSIKKAPKPKSIYLLLCLHNGKLGLIKRPSSGIWSELYTPLIFDSCEDLYSECDSPQSLPSYKHQLTHLTLTVYPFITNQKNPNITHWELLDNITVAVPTGIQKAIQSSQAYLSATSLIDDRT